MVRLSLKIWACQTNILKKMKFSFSINSLAMLVQLSRLIQDYIVKFKVEPYSVLIYINLRLVQAFYNNSRKKLYVYGQNGSSEVTEYKKGHVINWSTFNDCGEMMEEICYFKNGEMQAWSSYEKNIHFTWYPNGQIELKFTTKNRLLHGYYRKWNINGLLEVEEIYIKDELFCEMRWKNGIQVLSNVDDVEEIIWDEKGQIIKLSDNINKGPGVPLDTELRKYGYCVDKHVRGLLSIVK